MKYYDFIHQQRKFISPINSCLHLIAQQGKDIVGIELGLFSGDSFACILQACTNIKTLYGVDVWKPYSDYVVSGDLNKPDYTNYEKEVEWAEMTCRHRVKWSGHKDKAVIIKDYTDNAVKKFKNNYFDFIFLDSYLSYEQAKNDLKVWYPKLKKDGLYIGHDYYTQSIQQAVKEYREENNINNHMSIYDECFVWRK